LLDADSPFYIQPRLDPGLIRWLWRFRGYCNHQSQERAIPILRDMQRASLALYRQIISSEHIRCDFQDVGGVLAFRTQTALQAGVAHARRMADFGLALDVLDAKEIHDLEPALHPEVKGGVYHQEDAFLTPHKFVSGLAQAAQRLGVTILEGVEAQGFARANKRVTTVWTNQGDMHPRVIVLAAGIWTTALARQLDLSIPMQPAKGYSIGIPRPERAPRKYVIFAERNAVATPMGDELRFAGTLELSGLNANINHRRVNAIRKAAREYLLLPEEIPAGRVWQGLRPVPPDGLPYIGRSNQARNLFVATGHAMLGLSMGPITGKLVSELILSQPPSLPLDRFDVERFS
jgi:D-amino-acid dehydrogenase